MPGLEIRRRELGITRHAAARLTAAAGVTVPDDLPDALLRVTDYQSGLGGRVSVWFVLAVHGPRE